MENINTTSGKEFVDFWKRAADKGELKENTALSIQRACVQILQCTENWEILDIQKADLDDLYRRFVNKRGKDFKSASLSTYKTRLNTGVKMFLDYVKDPAAWKPRIKNRKPKQEPKIKTDESAQDDDSYLSDEPLQILPTPPVIQDSSFLTPLVDFRFPLRKGLLASFNLPTDLKSSEAKRIAIYLDSLVTDFEMDLDRDRPT